GGAPTVLTSGTNGYTSIALDATDVYFTRTDGVLGRVPIGGGAVTPLRTLEPTPESVAVDDTNFYWVRSSLNAVMSQPKSGGAPTELASPALLGQPVNPLVRLEGLTVRGSDLRFMVRTLPPLRGGELDSVPVNGGAFVQGPG